MVRRILEDNSYFHGIVKGRIRKELKRLMKTGGFISQRPNGSKFRVVIPGIEQPFFVHGQNGEGYGRGKGKEGDVVGKEPQQGDSNGGGDGHIDGITVGVDLEEFFKYLQDELCLPDMKPKPTDTFEDIKIRYNSISKIGPESLRHTRRTMLEAMKRLAASGDLEKTYEIPGIREPMKIIQPINSDKRYRQYQEEKIPSSNALIFFARDCSGSMDDERCDVVSNMAFWIDLWISRYYDKTERIYIVHDTEAEEVSKGKFYKYRHGGGTLCSSAFEKIAEIIENRFQPQNYNIYIFYFTDGDTGGWGWTGGWGESFDDRAKVLEFLKGPLGPNIINMAGITEIMPYNDNGNTLKSYIDSSANVTGHVGKAAGCEHIRTSLVESSDGTQIMEAIKAILGRERVFS